MRSRKCPVCTARMLVYENPSRLVCPRTNQHHLWLNGKKLGTQARTPPKRKKGYRKKGEKG